MEGKKRLAATAAAWCLLAVLLLSGQPLQVAAMSKSCRGFKQCYFECRLVAGTYPCNVYCVQDCIIHQTASHSHHRRRPAAADCNRFCLNKSICGVMSTDAMAVAADAQACMVDCRNSTRHSALLEDANLMS